MKSILSTILAKIIKPFFGSGLGNYRPLSSIARFYDSLIKDDSYCKTIYGITIKTHATDNVIKKSLKINGYREKNISDLIISNLHEGDICIDIGANIGYDTILMAKCVGNQGKVYAVEPIEKNYTLIKNNIQINQLSNVEVLTYGAGNKNESITINFSSQNPGGSSIYDNNRKRDSKEKIDIKILDEQIAGKKIDFIKMDVEGHELYAFMGINNIIYNSKPTIIFEWSPILYNSKNISLQILLFLLNHHYHLYHIHEDGSLEAIDNIETYYNRINESSFAQSDIYAKYNQTNN